MPVGKDSEAGLMSFCHVRFEKKENPIAPTSNKISPYNSTCAEVSVAYAAQPIVGESIALHQVKQTGAGSVSFLTK